ncbi:MAG: phage terminase large subunit [Planctomycetota bacterium]|nr:phage terminase large subunit [Planctomycetota bacterium]
MVFRAVKENGKVLWEEKFPERKIKEYKEMMGSVMFALQFQNDPSLCEGGFVKPEHIRYYSELPSKVAVYCGVDPAIAVSERSDYFAAVVIGVQEKTFYVIEAYQNRLSFKEQVEFLESLCLRHRPLRVAVETNAYQRVLAEMLCDRGVPVRAVQQVESKEKRIIRLAALFETGRVYLKKEQRELKEQILSYPDSEYDDLLDALSLSVQTASIKKTEYSLIAGL